MSEERLRYHKHDKEYRSWKGQSVERRDFRRALLPPETPRHRKKGRPSGKRWCRRKVGRKHSWTYTRKTYPDWVLEVCENCGKHGRMWHPHWVSTMNKEIPEKVQEMLDNPE